MLEKEKEKKLIFLFAADGTVAGLYSSNPDLSPSFQPADCFRLSADPVASAAAPTVRNRLVLFQDYTLTLIQDSFIPRSKCHWAD